jgi:hypothetical protein
MIERMDADKRGIIWRCKVEGRKFNIIFTEAGVYRSGDFHPNAQHDVLISGKVKVKLMVGERELLRILDIPGQHLRIPHDTPHLFYFDEDTVLCEWWEGEFSAEYYRPYRDIVEGKVRE